MLTPRKRITKKALKEDKLITLYAQATKWAEENIKLITYVGAAVLLLIVASIFIQNNRARSESVASVQLARAIHVFDANDYNNAISLLSGLVENHGGTKSGRIARLYLAQALYRTGEYAAAAEHFKKAAAKLGSDIHLKTTALAGEAACLEQQGEYAQAAEKYEKIVKKYPDAPIAPYILFRAARCFANAGDSTKAEILYQKLIDDYPDSREKNDALMLSAMQ